METCGEPLQERMAFVFLLLSHPLRQLLTGFYIFIYISHSVFRCSSSLCGVSVFLFPLQDRLMPTVSAVFSPMLSQTEQKPSRRVVFYMFMLILTENFFYRMACRAFYLPYIRTLQ